MKRGTYNIIVFNDTMNSCQNSDILKTNIALSKKNQRVYRQEELLGKTTGINTSWPHPININVSKDRTLQAAEKYDGKTVVLNFADFYKPGGLVKMGSGAQEESLCRISTLYPCIAEDPRVREEFYHHHRDCQYTSLYNDDIIYTPNVVVFKKDDNDMYDLNEADWYNVDVITCAAPNLREIDISADTLYRIQKSRIMRILEVADINGADNVILGAFGCGVFRNDPSVVAMAANDAIVEYTNRTNASFSNIEFAIYCPSKDMSNYEAFACEFNECYEEVVKEEDEDEEYDPFSYDDEEPAQ